MSVNKVILVGNVGKDPEVRYLDENTAIAKFPLATSETYKNRSGERVTNTEWHNVVLWRGLATVAERYVKKGTQLYIEGRIKTRSYDDQDGNRKYITEIVGDEMKLLGKRPDEGMEGGTPYGGSGTGAQSTQQAQSHQSASAPARPAPSEPSQPGTSSQPGASSQPGPDRGFQKDDFSSDDQQDDPFSDPGNGTDDLPF